MDINTRYTTIRDWAVAYRKAGLNVVPLYDYSKNPQTVEVNVGGLWIRGWKDLQSRQGSEKEFTRWFVEHTPTGLGVITGEISKLVVVDVDSYKPGGMAFHLDSPLKAKTARGGTHYFFKYVEPIKTTGLKEGVFIEIKSDGGFIVLPPSVVWVNEDHTQKGVYQWQEAKTKLDNLPPLHASDLERYTKSTTVYHDLHELVGATLGSQHNSLRTITLKTFARFPRAEWDLAEMVIRKLAQDFVPPHPESRVEKMIGDCKKYILENETVKPYVSPKTTAQVAKARLEEKELERSAPSTGWPELDEIVKGFIPGHLYTMTGLTNIGKCEGINTPHLMYDGSIKMVQDIVVGDLLMGPDSKPRRVLSLSRGKDEMFLIKQKWGIPYTVNKDHVLSLRWSTLRSKKMWKEYEAGKVINIPLSEYVKKSKAWKKFCKGWHASVEFPQKHVDIDPYFLGLWLGDGTSGSVSITTADPEIEEYIRRYTKEQKLSLRCGGGDGCRTWHLTSGRQQVFIDTEQGKLNKENAAIFFKKCAATITNWMKKGKVVFEKRQNGLYAAFKKYRLFNNKHIPFDFRVNTREKRLELLAGIIDTDGWNQKVKSKKTGKECFSYAISLTNKRLIDDIFLLIKSLGFNSRIHEKTSKMKRQDGTIYSVRCYTVVIWGNVEEIPVRVLRKKITSKRTKSVGLTLFDVCPLGVDDYYGFTLDGDGLYLLSDCTVTHNTAIATNFAIRVAKQKHHVLYYALEPENTVVDYLASVRNDKKFDELTANDISHDDPYISIYGKEEIGNLSDLILSIREAPVRYGLAIIDHIGYFIRKTEGFIQEQSNAIKELVGLAKEKRMAILLIAHFRKLNREQKKGYTPKIDDIAGSAAFAQDSTEVFIVSRKIDPEDPDGIKLSTDGSLYVMKTKAGPNGRVPLIFSKYNAFVATPRLVGDMFRGNTKTDISEVAQKPFVSPQSTMV